MEIKNINELSGFELAEIISSIKKQLGSGQISYDTAKEAAQVVIDEMNARIKKIARKNGTSAYKVSFAKLMR